jgi:sigma-B regulation protein RsbU (phosphoserine phosphatase)
MRPPRRRRGAPPPSAPPAGVGASAAATGAPLPEPPREGKAARRRRRRQQQSSNDWTYSRLLQLERFLRDYTAGFSTGEVKRLFRRDASSAYSVLTREHAETPEPKPGLRRLLFRAKLAFLGLSYKLTPARRMLFAASLICFVVALFTGSCRVETASGSGHHLTNITVDFSPLFFVACSAGLVFLLALELVDRVLVRDELEVARELQAELLPHGAIDLPGYSVAHSYRTANEVGGDYYEVVRLPDGRVAMMVGDATGHGMAAGLVMAIANATLKTALDIDPEPRRVLALLNRTLCRTGTKRTFMTVFYALLDPVSGELESISAGHPYPLLVRAGGGIEEVGTGSLPLGVRENLAPEPQRSVLAPGDLLLLYTDGLAEAVDARPEAFGYDRIATLSRGGGTPQQVHDRVLAAFDAHVGGEALHDDLTLLVVGRNPGPPAGGATP